MKVKLTLATQRNDGFSCKDLKSLPFSDPNSFRQDALTPRDSGRFYTSNLDETIALFEEAIRLLKVMQ